MKDHYRAWSNDGISHSWDTKQVVAFTATQIPGIDDRRYPPELAGPLYPGGIPIYPESELEHLVKDYQVDR